MCGLFDAIDESIRQWSQEYPQLVAVRPLQVDQYLTDRAEASIRTILAQPTGTFTLSELRPRTSSPVHLPVSRPFIQNEK